MAALPNPKNLLTTARKAGLAAALAAAGALGTGLDDGSLSGQECLLAVLAALVAGIGVYRVSNVDPPADD